MPSRQAKHWCWTLNNFTEDEFQALQALGQERPGIKYLVFGKEKGETGTPHLQGFISFEKKTTFKTAKLVISERAHLEPAKGSPAQASDYCKKDGEFEEFGTCPKGKGARSDLEDVAKKVKNGARMRDIAEEHPAAVLRYGSGIQRLRGLYRPKREGPPEIWVFWGKTGVGKTRRVWEFANVDELYVHPGGRWFDGFDGHRAVLFDDFDGSWFTITYLLKLVDRYMFQVPVKGSFVWWAPHVIYFTSNHHPKEWYKNASQDHQDALLRRIREFGSIQEVH
jgi:hypothetical protein